MKLTRYDGHVPLFSQNMEGRERTLFGSTVQDDDINNQFTPEFLRGWGSVGSTEFPTLQDFNALAYTHNKLLSYLYQAGIPSYTQNEEYYIGSIVQYNKDIYICLRDKPNVLPTDLNAWKRLINVSDMSQEVIDNDLLTVTSGAVYRALELKLDENVYATLTQKGIAQLTNTIDNSEDKAVTPKGIKEALDKLTPVGTVHIWLTNTAPDGYLFAKGQTFSKAQYPKLAQLFPDLKLPDFRGVVPRGLDDGRGFDAGRALLSYQSDEIKSHRHDLRAAINGSNQTFGRSEGDSPGLKNDDGVDYVNQTSAIQKFGGGETRMKNIALNFIIKAG